MFTRKVKENLAMRTEQQQKRRYQNKVDRSESDTALYDVNTFCAPFDLNRIDIEMLKK